ncbi:MAG TPA: MBL fold metallo-hydrolase, partial [Candidatus Hydrogenedentes bacterium]|nr:MBL fold metallo-hydrolase [Candidatus Hydrogenedentota bacterium]
LRNLYQVGGDLNGITWCGVDASFEDANTYAIQTPEGIALIDCGNGDTLPQIFDNMRYWGLNPEEIRACLITHPHRDHAGAAHLLKQRGVTLYAHRETASAIAAGDERCCGYLYHKPFVPCEVDTAVEDGDTVSVGGVTFSAMHLPGHTRGCTAWVFSLENRQIAACGDVIGTLLCGDFGWDGSIDFDKPLYIESLRRFARLDVDIMLAGHGLSYFHQPRRRVEQVLASALSQWR